MSSFGRLATRTSIATLSMREPGRDYMRTKEVTISLKQVVLSRKRLSVWMACNTSLYSDGPVELSMRQEKPLSQEMLEDVIAVERHISSSDCCIHIPHISCLILMLNTKILI